MNDAEDNFYLTHIKFNDEEIINNINQKEIYKKNIKKNTIIHIIHHLIIQDKILYLN